MSNGVNKVIIIGNLGSDPEAIGGSATATKLSVATSHSWNDRATGNKKEHTEWHRVALFGKLAEVAFKYLRKGSKVYIEGSLKTSKYQDKSGNERYSTDIMAKELRMLDSKSKSDDEYNPDSFRAPVIEDIPF